MSQLSLVLSSHASSGTLVDLEVASSQESYTTEDTPLLHQPRMQNSQLMMLSCWQATQRGLVTPVTAAMGGTLGGLAGGFLGVLASPVIAGAVLNESMLTRNNSPAYNDLFVRILRRTLQSTVVLGASVGATVPWLGRGSTEKLMRATFVLFLLCAGADTGAFAGAISGLGLGAAAGWILDLPHNGLEMAAFRGGTLLGAALGLVLVGCNLPP